MQVHDITFNNVLKWVSPKNSKQYVGYYETVDGVLVAVLAFFGPVTWGELPENDRFTERVFAVRVPLVLAIKHPALAAVEIHRAIAKVLSPEHFMGKSAREQCYLCDDYAALRLGSDVVLSAFKERVTWLEETLGVARSYRNRIVDDPSPKLSPKSIADKLQLYETKIANIEKTILQMKSRIDRISPTVSSMNLFH